MTEAEAIQRLKAGDIGGLEALVRLHQVSAVRTAYLITQDRALAEDVVQEAFLQFFDHSATFDDKRPFRPYFLRGVVNRAVKAARKANRHLPLDADDERLPAHDLLAAADTREAVSAALAQLSPEQRAAIVLRYYLDMSEAEISAEVHAPRGTIKWRLHAARLRLRALLHSFHHATEPPTVKPDEQG